MTEGAKRETHAGEAEDAPAAGPSAADGDENGTRQTSGLGWGKALALMAWGFVVLAFAAGGLADVTNLWWLVLVFGVAAPFLFVALQNRAVTAGRERVPVRDGEREVLDALREHGELSPASAAMLTSLTVDEASGIMEFLARGGTWSLAPATARSCTPCASGTGRSWEGRRRNPERRPEGRGPRRENRIRNPRPSL